MGIGADACRRVFQEFKGLPHRLEYVAEAGGVKFINDSKATLAESTVWALKNISSPVVLIAGGKDKGIDYASILEAARGKVKQVVLIGEAKEKIAQALAGALPVQGAPTLEEAVSRAYSLADPGDCVLLSPMCSSFDMFRDYEERGRIFKQAVRALKEGAVSHGA